MRVRKPYLKSEDGISLPAILIFCAIVTSLGAYSLDHLITASQFSQSSLTNLDLKSARSVAYIVLRSRPNCKVSLLDGDFGVELSNRLANPGAPISQNLVVKYPSYNGSNDIMFSSGQKIGSLTIESVSLTKFEELDTNPKSYLADVRVRFQNSFFGTSAATNRGVSLPVYVVKDGTGAFVGCHVSNFVGSNLTITVEDQLCANTNGADSRFDPVNRNCTGG